MKYRRSQLLIVLILIAGFISFIYDLIEYYSSLNFQLLSYVDEALALGNVLLFYLFLRKRPLAFENDVYKNLKSFIFLLGVLYVVVLLLRLIFPAEFTSGVFPQEPATISALVYSNLISLVVVFLITPMLLIIRNLVRYRYKKRTRWFVLFAFLATTALILYSVIFNKPLDFNFSHTPIFSFEYLLGVVAFIVAMLALFLISMRNSWITYLSRKEKISYFFLSIPVIWLIIYIFDFAFAKALPAHSLALAVFAYLAWLFLVFYALMSSLNLLIHLPTARVFERKMKEVASLQNLSRAISAEFNFDRLVRQVTDMNSEVLKSVFTWLEIYDEKTKQLHLISSSTAGFSKPLKEQSPLPGLSHKIITTRKPQVLNELSKEEQEKFRLLSQQKIASLAAVPLLGANERIFGILYAAKPTAFGFDPDDVNMLEAFANQASIAMENVELVKNSLKQERLEKELQIAREVQLRLLPQNPPQIPGLDMESLTITAYEVGGDYHDFYSVDETGLGIVIGDVSGKGTSAAFYMAEAKGIIQSLARIFTSPRDILVETNKILYASLEKKAFISMLSGRVNLTTGSFWFSRAGHCPVIQYSAASGSATLHQPEGIAVGLDSGSIFDAKLQQARLSLGAGDILALYTDGLSEARNAQGQEFGEERLCALLKKNADLSASDLKDAVIDEILKFLDGQNLHDDLTLLLIKIK